MPDQIQSDESAQRLRAPQVGEWQHPSAIRTPPGHPTSPEAAS